MTLIVVSPLTTDSDLARKIAATHRGMAHWAGTGPVGTTCGDCGYFRWKLNRFAEGTCAKPRPGGRDVFPALTASCRFFEGNPLHNGAYGMNIGDAFPSKFLRAADLKGRNVRLEIDSVAYEQIGSDRRLVLYFDGKAKGLVCNKTCEMTLTAEYGFETDNWIGAIVELIPVTVPFKGEQIESIRVCFPTPDQVGPAASNPGGGSDAEGV